MKNRFFLLSACCLFGHGVFCQPLPTTYDIKSAYLKETRTLSGKPGKNYWQNRGDYDIRIVFDPTTNLLRGEETITYFNNSPDTLWQLVIRLYPDLYKKGVERLTPINDKDLTDGVQIESLNIESENSNLSNEAKAFRQGTNLIVRPSGMIMPHSKITLNIKWNYFVNTGSQQRTGRVDSSSFFIAYFFPRIAVYDDIDGWDMWSYNGTQEFYNDFGNFNIEISVPKSFVVWATGTNTNLDQNLSEHILAKYKTANTSPEIIHVIDSNDYSQNKVLSKTATGVWKFAAENVTDFAFAISDHYLWDVSSVIVDSTTGRRTLAEAAYNPIHEDYFDVANQAHQSVYYMSHYYPKYPFPFPHITVFDGTDQMEYPMMANDNPTQTHKYAVQLTTHEIFHSYFPFYMGINETQYAWMDEGWAAIGESVISALMGEPEGEGIYGKTGYEEISGTNKDIPLITNTKLYSDETYYSNSYGRGGLCYYVLQTILGDNLYFKSLHQYMNDWHGKHPTPYDFFYSINTASGKDLNWFWNRWFFGWQYPDLAIEKVVATKNGSAITISNKGGLPVPVYLNVSSASGKKTVLQASAEVWKDERKEFVIETKISMKEISKITLGNEFIPEKNRDDNEWTGGN